MNQTMTWDPNKQGRPQYAEAVERFYTCSQSAIPETVAEIVSLMDGRHYSHPKRWATLKEARSNIDQTGPHNVLLEDQGDGNLKIVMILWDSM